MDYMNIFMDFIVINRMPKGVNVKVTTQGTVTPRPKYSKMTA